MERCLKFNVLYEAELLLYVQNMVSQRQKLMFPILLVKLETEILTVRRVLIIF